MIDNSLGHDARSIARRMIRTGVERDQLRDPLQVIKLTYLCHGWMLGLYGQPLSRQSIEAWRYGPVVADVYHAVKRFGSQPIAVSPFHDLDNDQFDDRELDLMGQVFEVYRDFSGIQLSQLTHEEGSPWHQVWTPGKRHLVIPNELIERHFAELAEADG